MPFGLHSPGLWFLQCIRFMWSRFRGFLKERMYYTASFSFLRLSHTSCTSTKTNGAGLLYHCCSLYFQFYLKVWQYRLLLVCSS